MKENLTDYLVEQTRKLPVEQLREVIDFTEFLLSKTPTLPAGGNGHSAAALTRFVGGVSHGAIASGIDDELYGSALR